MAQDIRSDAHDAICIALNNLFVAQAFLMLLMLTANGICGSSVSDALDAYSTRCDALMITTRRFCVAHPFVLKMCRMVKDD